MKTSKKTRRGFAGDDVTENKDYQEEVLKSEDDSYVVEDTDSPEEITEESEVITDDHEVVIDEDTGTEEDFVAEAEDGEAEEIDEEEISDEREGRRGKRIGKRHGVRKSRIGRKRLGESDEPEDDIEKEDEEVEELIMNEDGDTEEVELPEPDEEREGRRGKRRGVRHGSRKGATIVDGKSPLKYLMMLEYLQGFPEEREIIESGDEDAAEEYLRKDAEINGQTYEEAVRSIEEEYSDDDSYLGGRKGSRKGNIYGGKSPEHQESIRAAVSIAMKDRRL